MKRYQFLIFFSVAIIFDLAFIYLKQDEWRYFSKPLLMPLLMIYFIINLSLVKSGFKKWIILALLFSWLGDIFLMFETGNPVFFLPGLSSFLLAHIFYILFFHKLKSKERINYRPVLWLPVVVYFIILIMILYPRLGDMKIPVPVYGIVISLMLLLALHMNFIKDKKAGRLMMFGAVLFVISDSVLAMNKFYEPFETAGVLIMLLYGLAQFLITFGAAAYIQSVNTF